MINKLCIFVCIFSVSALSFGSKWNETVDAILLNLQNLTIQQPANKMIADSLTLTKRLLTTHKNSYLKKEIEKKGIKTVSEELYFSEHDFFVTVYKSESNLHEYNLYHDAGWIYQWNEGEKNGVKYPVSTNELINYVGYSINPLGLVSTFYEDYLQYPDTFIAHKNEGEPWTELEFTVRRFAYKSLLVDLDNTWFYGFKIFNPKTNEISTSWINPVQSYDSLPKSKIEAIKNIEFKQDNNQSLKQYMKYVTAVPGKHPE